MAEQARHILRRRHRGTVLVAAMIIIFALVAMVLVMGQSARVEAMASANQAAGAEAAVIARGAEQYVLGLLSESTDPPEMLDERYFAAVELGTGYFWLLRPDYDDTTLPEFGLVDESSKLDLNRVTRDGLLNMPGMTEELASAIIDWRDEDDTPETAGAESDTYLARSSYEAKNGPFEMVEEMLLLNTMTRELLYGPDRTQETAATIGGTFATELYQRIGFFDFFTVWGAEAMLDPDDEARVNVNGQENRQALQELLEEKFGASRGQQILNTIGEGTVRGIIDFAVRAGLTEEEFETIEDYIIAQPVAQQGQNPPAQPLRVNLNYAPREVLLALENLTENDIDLLIARRPGPGAAKPTSLSWVLDVFGDRQANREKLADLSNQVTGRGAYYSADIVAVAGNGRAFKRVRIVVDCTTTNPRIVYRRDLTDRGWPLDPNIRTSLRHGAGI